jgi:hypothetical protein
MSARTLNPRNHKSKREVYSALAFLFTETWMSKRSPLAFKQTDLRRAIRAFQKAGLPIARAEIDRDGKNVIVTGEPNSKEKGANEWDQITQCADLRSS